MLLILQASDPEAESSRALGALTAKSQSPLFLYQDLPETAKRSLH